METLAIDWICGSSAWVRPTAAISSPMLSRPSTANQPASPITAATNVPVTAPEPARNLPSSPALRLAPTRVSWLACRYLLVASASARIPLTTR